MSHGAEWEARREQYSLASAVVNAVADQADVAPTELDRPLDDAINTEALNHLFDRAAASGYVVFQYQGYRVQVLSDGDVRLTEQSE